MDEDILEDYIGDVNFESITVKRKPIKCPKCGFRPISNIVYGYPSYSEKMQEELNNKKIVLGGCCLDDYLWMCTKCKTRFILDYSIDGIMCPPISVK